MKVIQFTIPVAGGQSVIVQEDKLPHFYNHLHRHKEAQITWVIKGSGTLLAGDYMQRFKPGAVYVLGANQPHLFKSDPVYFRKKAGQTVQALTLFFDTQQMATKLLAMQEMKRVQQFIEASAAGMQVPDQWLPVVIAAMRKVKSTRNALRLAAFIELLDLLAGIRKWKPLSTSGSQAGISDTEGLRMNDVYQYSIAHYTENIPLPAIAAVAHLTPQAFCRYFKKHTRKTYVAFLNEIRITEACKKMVQGQFESFSAIAYQTGFNNVVTFNRVFRRVTGLAPGEYYREYQAKASN